MPVQDIGDPRLQALFGARDPREAGVRPTVRLPRKSLPPVALALIVITMGAILFAVLNGRRMNRDEPADSAVMSEPGAWQAPPPLYTPPVPAPIPAPPTIASGQLALLPRADSASTSESAMRPVPPSFYALRPATQLGPPFTLPPLRVSSGAPLVIDTSSIGGLSAAATPIGSELTLPNQLAGRVRASAFANQSTTVPQGYIIPAVLETGFDSTQPGFARAIVSRDVRGFDGENILIPRGSRLIGEYRSEVATGQKRAIITWTRLIRPDGMTIALDSPAVDSVGRGGVPASVNSHFFQRLTGALLQSAFSIGASLAGRSTGSVVVLPGASAAAAQAMPTNEITPTLTVAAGKSISVFVAHDLDFSSAEAVR